MTDHTDKGSGAPAHEDGAGHDGGGPGHGGGPPGWFDRPENVRRFLRGFYVLCGAFLVWELLIHRHVELGLEGLFGFYAVYGFVGIVLLVLVSILLRKVVRRSEDYYGR